MGKFRWWKCSLRHCSVLDENRLKRRKKNSAAAITFFKLTLMSGDSSTTTMGSLGCGSGRTVTVRILELITAGGLQRHAQSHGQKQKKKCYFLRTGVHTWVKLEFFLWDSVKWWGKIRGMCRRASFDIPHTRLRSGCMIISAHQRRQHEINLSGQQMTL